VQPLLDPIELVREPGRFALRGLDVAAARLHGADPLRALVAPVSQAFRFDLEALAFRLERRIALAVEHEAAARKIARHRVEILSQRARIEHLKCSVRTKSE